MILIDTNIISEIMKAKPSAAVLQWLNEQPCQSLYTSSITIAEIKFGLSLLSKGRRRSQLEERFNSYIDQVFDGRILSFTPQEGDCFAQIMSHNKAIGHPMSFADGQIAAIARTALASPATRNIKDFAHCNLELINPFSVR